MPLLEPYRSEQSVLPPRAMVLSGPGLLSRVRVWVYGPTTASVCFDIHDYIITTENSEDMNADLVLSLPGLSTRENWPYLIPTASLRRPGPIPLLGSSVELTLLVGVQVS